MKIIRVFPRKTSCTPQGPDVRVNEMPGFFDEADEVHISVSWSYDLKRAEQLYNQWKHVAECKIGGAATGQREGEFVAGMYVKKGCTITSRGCPNRCWFCREWRINGTTRELPIVDGNNVLDSNLLACSEKHIRTVFAMLKRQKEKAKFTGGLEARILKRWHCELLKDISPQSMFFAYDTPDDREPFIEGMRLLDNVGVSRNARYCYALCGYPKDTFEAAEKRFAEIFKHGAMPFAMLYRNDNGEVSPDWQKFQREYVRPALARRKLNNLLEKNS